MHRRQLLAALSALALPSTTFAQEKAAMHPATVPEKASIFITGSSDGIGRAAAKVLLGQGHRVVVHARSEKRLEAVQELLQMGAIPTTGDLADAAQVRALAQQVNAIGTMDAIIHNAGIYSGDSVLAVNTVAPYLLTALIRRPKRLIYISSGMHRGGNPANLDFAPGRGSYSDSKLFVTALMAAVARLWPDTISSAVDPGWVPTKMGGAGAPDDLRLGHLTQEWLATSNDAAAMQSGGYWHHQQRQTPHKAVGDVAFQDKLLAALATHTGVKLPSN